MKLRIVQPWDFELAWPSVERFIKSALCMEADPEKVLLEIKEKVHTGVYRLIADIRDCPPAGAATIEYYAQGGQLICNIVTVGHDGLEDGGVAEFLGMVEDIAINYGCDAIRVHGRRGWTKVLRDHGFRPIYTALEKRI